MSRAKRLELKEKFNQQYEIFMDAMEKWSKDPSQENREKLLEANANLEKANKNLCNWLGL